MPGEVLGCECGIFFLMVQIKTFVIMVMWAGFRYPYPQGKVFENFMKWVVIGLLSYYDIRLFRN